MKMGATSRGAMWLGVEISEEVRGWDDGGDDEWDDVCAVMGLSAEAA